MNVSIKNNNITPNFQAKLSLKDLNNLCYKIPAQIDKTNIDTMFNENYFVRELDKFSVFLTKNVLCKYFSKPTTRFEKILALFNYKMILYARKLADRIFLFENYNRVSKTNKKFVEIKDSPQRYIEELSKIGNSIDGKFIRGNFEDGILKNIAKSKNATIFVLNHPNYHKDKFIYVILNAILSKLYVNQNKQENCPLPKILVSRNMLKVVHSKIGNIYKEMGLTPIDASLENKDRNFNTNSIHSLLKEFITNKSNIFIFPEGNNSTFQDRPLEDRIQNGVANFVKKAVNNKRSVRVVPVSIQYNDEKNSLGNIFIGKPLYFRKKKDEVIYTSGIEKQKISSVNYKESTPAILDIICQSLKYGIKRANKLSN